MCSSYLGRSSRIAAILKLYARKLMMSSVAELNTRILVKDLRGSSKSNRSVCWRDVLLSRIRYSSVDGCSVCSTNVRNNPRRPSLPAPPGNVAAADGGAAGPRRRVMPIYGRRIDSIEARCNEQDAGADAAIGTMFQALLSFSSPDP